MSSKKLKAAKSKVYVEELEILTQRVTLLRRMEEGSNAFSNADLLRKLADDLVAAGFTSATNPYISMAYERAASLEMTLAKDDVLRERLATLPQTVPLGKGEDY